MPHQPFFNPKKSYSENFTDGPFGEFANGKKYRNQSGPNHDFLESKISLPFGIPAGPLINSNFVKAAFDKGFDICVYKTVRTRKYPCQQWPNVIGVKIKGDLTLKKAQGKLTATNDYLHPLSITNSFGVPSPTPDWWQEDMQKALKSAKSGQLLIGSFQGTTGGTTKDYIQDFVLAAKLVSQTGVKVLIANLSCPNEGTSHMLCFDTKRTLQIVEAIKNEIGNTPLLIKLAYFANQQKFKQLIQSVGSIVQGLAVINTIPATVIDKQGNQALPGKGRAVSGICGHSIKWAGLEMVNRLKLLREELSLDFSIIGVGGVTQAQDYHEYIKVGADAVLSATGAMWNPFLAQEIKSGISH